MRSVALWIGLAACALAPAAAGCRSVLGLDAPDLPGPDGWVESRTFQCFDEDLLWETCKNQAARSGYYIDDDATLYKRRRVVTRWKTQLMPTHGDGARKRRFVEMIRLPGRKAGWRVRVAVVKQRNDEIDEPLNPLSAEWRSDKPDTDEAERLAYLIENRFRDPGPSPEFEER